ncbi:MAG TPA: hypothetical protein VF796_16590 [Humisphaera sp.]
MTVQKTSDLAARLRASVVGAMTRFRRARPAERPYALAVLVGQDARRIWCAVATEEGLRETVAEYRRLGYRHHDFEGDESDDQAGLLAAWLRWANPDDGWRHVELDDGDALGDALGHAFQGDALTPAFEAFMTDVVLASLRHEPGWLAVGRSVIAGYTSGQDPADFVRSATRANDHQAVATMWGEWRRGETVGRSVRPPDAV